MKTFTGEYRKLGKHRKKCRHCGVLIKDGELTTFRSTTRAGYYPIRGIMRFHNWLPFHAECFTECYPGEKEKTE